MAHTEDDDEPLVRPYLITGGRTVSHGNLDRATQVTAVVPRPRMVRLNVTPEHRLILTAAQYPVSVAELSAKLAQPLGVVRVLVADLIEHGAILAQAPIETSEHVLRKVLDGLSRL